MRVMKRCIVCGNEFIADRRTAKYCSKICHTKSKSLRPREDAIEQMIIKQKEKSSQPETMACCRHPDCFYHGTKNTTPTCVTCYTPGPLVDARFLNVTSIGRKVRRINLL